MPRIAGVDLPREKRAEIALTYVFGIGRTLAKEVCGKAGVDADTRIRDVTEDEAARINDIIQNEYMVEGDLRREVQGNIKRLIEIGTYRGMRHRRGLPVRGQRTRTNARTRKGRKKTVAGKKKALHKT